MPISYQFLAAGDDWKCGLPLFGAQLTLHSISTLAPVCTRETVSPDALHLSPDA